MKMRSVMVALLGLAILGVAISSAVAQPPVPEVTNEHKLLKKDVGVWEAEMTIWMEGPDKEPLVTKGVERARAVGDYWVVTMYMETPGVGNGWMKSMATTYKRQAREGKRPRG